MRWAYEWDEAKSRENIAKHGIDFADTHRIFEGPMLVRPDDRQDYGEERWIALGDLDGTIVVIVFTQRADRIRVISIRKANRRERKTYQEGLSRTP
jgi:uncharacterized DUF497 family protein